jgi:hypothetical protein
MWNCRLVPVEGLWAIIPAAGALTPRRAVPVTRSLLSSQHAHTAAGHPGKNLDVQ